MPQTPTVGDIVFPQNFLELKKIDQKEQEFIIQYANKGYQMRNKTTGGQNSGKKDLGDKLVKGLSKRMHNGYKFKVKRERTLQVI